MWDSIKRTTVLLIYVIVAFAILLTIPFLITYFFGLNDVWYDILKIVTLITFIYCFEVHIDMRRKKNRSGK